MNVVRLGERPLGADNRPAWCEVAGMGLFRIRPGATFDPHFHDSPEYWLFYEGKGKVAVDDETYYVQAGDVVCTPTGARHDIVEIYEELEGFYLEEKVGREGKVGHRHRDAADAAGHVVPAKPLPEDFPRASRAGVIVSEPTTES
jgi:mannose-6-phosphate isomerase-like protein (cupin superfamily)